MRKIGIMLIILAVVCGFKAETSEGEDDYVDLGLPSGTKWARCNLGATTPEDPGKAFAWGEVQTKDVYSIANSATENVSLDELYAFKIIDSTNTLSKENDAVFFSTGGKGRIPTAADFKELLKKCKWEYTTLNGVAGYKVISKKTGNHIFLPLCPLVDAVQANPNAVCTYTPKSAKDTIILPKGYYWTSTSTDEPLYSKCLTLSPKKKYFLYGFRHIGKSIRPVS